MALDDSDAEAELEPWIDRAFAGLDQVGGDPRRLEEPLRTVAIVVSAQGVIDNGGLRSFFESDWPQQPPYADFAAAYRRIGADASAAALEAAATLFPFEHPERHQDRRRELLAGPMGERVDALTDWDTDVWTLLAAHVAPSC